MSPRRHHPRRHAKAPVLRTEEDALDAIARLLDVPRVAEVLCLLLDAAYRIRAVLVFDGLQPADDVVHIAETVTHLAPSAEVHAVVLASFRPGAPFTLGDVERWHRMSDVFAHTELDLLEWFVLDEHTTVAVGAAAGDAPGWPAGDG